MNLRSRFHIQKAESRDGVLAHQHDRGATMARTTSDFCSGSPPSLRSVEDDKRGTLMCFFDVEDDVGGARLCFLVLPRLVKSPYKTNLTWGIDFPCKKWYIMDIIIGL